MRFGTEIYYFFVVYCRVLWANQHAYAPGLSGALPSTPRMDIFGICIAAMVPGFLPFGEEPQLRVNLKSKFILTELHSTYATGRTVPTAYRSEAEIPHTGAAENLQLGEN